MSRSFFYRVRKHAWIIILAIITAFVLLVILGFALGPDKMWGPPAPK